MRIALFHNAPSGGAKRTIFEWTQRLAEKHIIDVFTLSTADHAYCDIRPFVQNYYIYDFSPHSLFDSPLGRLNQIQRWRDLVELQLIGQQIASEINSKKYDIVFANTCFYTFIPAFLKHIQLPAVYYLHEPFGQMFNRNIPRPYIKQNKRKEAIDRFDPFIRLYQQRLNNIQRDSIYNTKLFLANSFYTKEQMKIMFNIDAQVCYLGVNIENFRPNSGIGKKSFVLSVGELSPRKGFDFIVESLGQIASYNRPKLVIACNRIDQAEKVYIEILAKQYEVDLEVRSGLDTNELKNLYNEALFCVYAPVMEPFGLVPLEAMACGIPVVAVYEGGVRESIINKKTGLLVSRNPVEFANAVQELLLNPALAHEYGRNGREFVINNWNWEKSTNSLEQSLIDCAFGGSNQDQFTEKEMYSTRRNLA